jgi:hypothetical protein
LVDVSGWRIPESKGFKLDAETQKFLVGLNLQKNRGTVELRVEECR